MELAVWGTFVLAGIVFSLAPGSGAVCCISNALHGNMKSAAQGILGLQLALLVHLLIVSFGMGTLLASSATLFTAVTYLGAGYLCYLGFNRIFCANSGLLSDTNTTKLVRKRISEAFFINIMNPKSIVFLAAFLPQFVTSTQPIAQQYTILSITTIVIDTLAMFGYAMATKTIKPLFASQQSMQRLNRVFGVLFVLLAIALVRADS